MAESVNMVQSDKGARVRLVLLVRLVQAWVGTWASMGSMLGRLCRRGMSATCGCVALCGASVSVCIGGAGRAVRGGWSP